MSYDRHKTLENTTVSRSGETCVWFFDILQLVITRFLHVLFSFISQGVHVSPKLHFMSEAHEHGRKIQIAPQYVVNSEFVASHGGNSFAKSF